MTRLHKIKFFFLVRLLALDGIKAGAEVETWHEGKSYKGQIEQINGDSITKKKLAIAAFVRWDEPIDNAPHGSYSPDSFKKGEIRLTGNFRKGAKKLTYKKLAIDPMGFASDQATVDQVVDLLDKLGTSKGIRACIASCGVANTAKLVSFAQTNLTNRMSAMASHQYKFTKNFNEWIRAQQEYPKTIAALKKSVGKRHNDLQQKKADIEIEMEVAQKTFQQEMNSVNFLCASFWKDEGLEFEEKR